MAKPNFMNSIKMPMIKKNVFDLSHDFKFSGNMGELIPVMVQECIPGDRYTIGADTMIRFAPLIAPVMHRFDATIHYFFVPNRILWDNWEGYIGGDDENAVHPYVRYTPTNYSATKLIDYLGLPAPTGAATGDSTKVSAIPFAAYQCIYNEYYRDQNLQAEVNYKLVDGQQTTNLNQLLPMRNRAWQHDYFTAALPFAQKGAAVDIPIGAVQPRQVYYNDSDVAGTDYKVWDATGQPSGSNTNQQVWRQELDPLESPIPGGRMYADGGDVEPTTINELRRAFALQRWMEKIGRVGSRYVELLKGIFNVRSSDARLQRPEYIVGVKTPVIISEVLNTTGEQAGLPQGNMAGHGVAVSTGKAGNYFCEEHGYIIGIMSVMPLTAYQQGVPRHFIKEDRFHYFWPDFAHIGEQEVYNKELYVDSSEPEGTFGYMPRYAEYRYNPSRVAGDFKTTLNFWHMGRIFETEPALNSQFVTCNPDKRIFAVQDEDVLYCHVLNKVRAVRPIPKFGTPI
ncbi:major capsid protein [Tortoise microvirus 89]|nr:major capsid protein [Tortoise microvirus 89]